MSTTFTTNNDVRFPAGTVLYCFPSVGLIPAAPAVDSATVQSNGSCTFEGLEYSARYVVGTSMVGPFAAFRTSEEPAADPTAPAVESVTLAMLSDPLRALLVIGRVHDGANYPERIAGVAFNHWVGPSAPPNFEDGDVWTPTA